MSEQKLVKFVIALDGYERRGRIRTAKKFYVQKVRWADRGCEIKSFQWSDNRTAAAEFGKITAETLCDQIRRSFLRPASVEAK